MSITIHQPTAEAWEVWSYGRTIYLCLDDIKELNRQLSRILEVQARQRISNAQDTVDQIRSDKALRSDFV